MREGEIKAIRDGEKLIRYYKKGALG